MKRLIPFLFLAVLFACEDDEPTDTRDQSLGTYDYRMKYYTVSGNTLTYMSGYDDTGTLVVEKNTDGLKFVEGGTTQFEGNKVAKASNGFTFDIPSQSFKVDGVSYTMEGYDGIELGSVKYNGAYFSDLKQVKAYFFIENGQNDIVIEYTSTKK